MPEDRRRKRSRRTDRSSSIQSQRSSSLGRQRTASTSAQSIGLKNTEQPATAPEPEPDPFLDFPNGHEPAKWVIPPVVASRFGLPVRFPDLWTDEPLEAFLHNLRPAELWEALFATLWRLAKQKDPKWTKRMEYEIDYRLFKASKNHENPIPELLSLKRVRTGRPQGAGGIARLGNGLPIRHRLLSSGIGRDRTRERGYTPTTMAYLEDWWEESRDSDDFPVRQFPKAQIQRELDLKKPPAEIADIVLAHAFGVSPDSVRAHLKKALRRIPPEIKRMFGLSGRPRKPL